METLIEKIKEFQKVGYGLEGDLLDQAIAEMKRTEQLLRALTGYDLALFKLCMDLHQLEQCKFHREMRNVRI